MGLALALAALAPCVSWSLPAGVVLAALAKKPAKIKERKAPAPAASPSQKAAPAVSLDTAASYNYFHLAAPRSPEPAPAAGPALPAKAPKAPAARAVKL